MRRTCWPCWLLAGPLAAAAVWQVAQPAADLARGNAPPYAPQTAALVRGLYEVTGTSPPAQVTGSTPAQITLRMTRAGATIVRVYRSPLLRAAGAAVARDGPWVRLTAPRPGRYVLSAPYRRLSRRRAAPRHRARA